MTWWEIRREVPRRTRFVVGCLSLFIVLAVWSFLSYGGHVNSLFLPTPTEVLLGFWTLLRESNLLGNLAISWWRITQAFLLSVVIALPLGILMGAFKVVDAFFSPVTDPFRTLPITVFIPILMFWFGLTEGFKVAFLFVGVFFYLLPVVREEVAQVREEVLQTAYTLGARKAQVLLLLFWAILPQVFTAFRVLYGIGWTYLIVVEAIHKTSGLGKMMDTAYRYMATEQTFAGVIAIALAALLNDWFLKQIDLILFPWKRQTD